MINFNLKKIFFITQLVAIFLIVSLKLIADDNKIDQHKITIGSYDAAVKIKIFSSLTCPHCADFHIKVIPKTNIPREQPFY